MRIVTWPGKVGRRTHVLIAKQFAAAFARAEPWEDASHPDASVVRHVEFSDLPTSRRYVLVVAKEDHLRLGDKFIGRDCRQVGRGQSRG